MKRLHNLMDLTGRSAIIAGGGGYIGAEAAAVLVELGATVALLDIDTKKTWKLAAQLNEIRPDSASAVLCDLSLENATRASAREAASLLGGCDILIHTAALTGMSKVGGWAVPFEQQSVEAMNLGFQINVTSAFVLAQELRGELRKSGKGSIVFIGSIFGSVAPDMEVYRGTQMANPVGYGASKGGLLQMTNYLSSLLAPEIRVNAISPGGVERGQPEVFQQRYRERTPLRRMATEDDLGGAFAYLASDMSSYVTGQNLVVDGGYSTW
jgi:NAD(P)-dependent dehydrogenase (short-subunit alcohol dehydrogenase family)